MSIPPWCIRRIGPRAVLAVSVRDRRCLCRAWAGPRALHALVSARCVVAECSASARTLEHVKRTLGFTLALSEFLRVRAGQVSKED
jgi:hypothetical protein